jgi:hypothetical protein
LLHESRWRQIGGHYAKKQYAQDGGNLSVLHLSTLEEGSNLSRAAIREALRLEMNRMERTPTRTNCCLGLRIPAYNQAIIVKFQGVIIELYIESDSRRNVGIHRYENKPEIPTHDLFHYTE